MPDFASILDLSNVTVTLFIFSVWVVTPASWLYALASLFQHYTDRPAVLPSGLHKIILGWSIVEVLFSIYYAHLARRVQRRGQAPLYGRRFLRMVFSRALESGLGDVKPLAAGVGEEDVSNGKYNLRRRRVPETIAGQGSEKTQPKPNRLATPRLRSASYLPKFVEEPLDRTDPRAIEFAEQQAMWFPDSRPEDLTSADVNRWLAWSLYGMELSELEEERRQNQANNVHKTSNSNGNGNDPGMSMATHLLSSRSSMQPPLLPSSPVPAAQGSFARMLDDSEDDDDDDDSAPLSFEKEDRRGVRAVEGEWEEDPMRGDRLEFIDYCRDLIAARQGFEFPAPKSDHQPLRAMRLTLDPVVVRSRPLILYLLLNSLSYMTYLRARWDGFQLGKEGRIKYLIYRPKEWSQEKAAADPAKYRPIIFLHGLGIGIGQYSPLIRHLRHTTTLTKTHPLLIPLQPHISQAIFDPYNHLHPIKHHEFTALFRRVFKREGWTKTGVTVLSHSNGTTVHSWLLKSAGDFVKRSCFVDPVVFQLWVPHIVGNFLYRRPASAVMKLIAYFVASELGTANMLFRHFDWSSCLLWPQDEIPNLLDPHACQIYLAEKDAIVHAADTRQYLRSFGMQEVSDTVKTDKSAGLHYIRGAAHGEILMTGGGFMEKIVDWLDEPDP